MVACVRAPISIEFGRNFGFRELTVRNFVGTRLLPRIFDDNVRRDTGLNAANVSEETADNKVILISTFSLGGRAFGRLLIVMLKLLDKDFTAWCDFTYLAGILLLSGIGALISRSLEIIRAVIFCPSVAAQAATVNIKINSNVVKISPKYRGFPPIAFSGV